MQVYQSTVDRIINLSLKNNTNFLIYQPLGEEKSKRSENIQKTSKKVSDLSCDELKLIDWILL